MKVIFEGTEEQIKNLKLLIEQGDNSLPDIIDEECINKFYKRKD